MASFLASQRSTGRPIDSTWINDLQELAPDFGPLSHIDKRRRAAAASGVVPPLPPSAAPTPVRPEAVPSASTFQFAVPLARSPSSTGSQTSLAAEASPPPSLTPVNPGSPPANRKSLRGAVAPFGPPTMPWYNGGTVNRQQGQQQQQPQQQQQNFGGTPMTATQSGPGSSYNGQAGQQQHANGNADTALVWPALHLHPMNDTFVPKQISLAPPGPHNRVKIGRQTNAKTAPHPSNGYFDSKVLSRMHAEVWCQDGKMYIKDVKSSNGTFINGERLSAEAQESDIFELHNEDLVEFGIDIVGDDNKTIIHHKVACRVYLVLTAEEALAMRNDFANMYRSGSNGGVQNGPMGGAGSGPAGEGGLRRGKGSMSFDHILGRLQMELQKSREDGAALGSLGSTISDMHESMSGNAGLPPMSEPPYPGMVPSLNRDGEQQQQQQGVGEAPSTAAIEALQTQLAETQSSLTNHVDKVKALETMLAEHEAIKAEVGSIKSQMDVLANVRTQQHQAPTLEQIRLATGDDGRKSSAQEDSDFDDGASMTSLGTITPDADVGDAPRGNDEIEDMDMSDEDDHVGPRAPPDLPPGVSQVPREVEPSTRSTSSSSSSIEERLQTQNKALVTRLEALESQLEEALSFGRTLQSQHSLATAAVKTLEDRVQSLEQDVSGSLKSAAASSVSSRAVENSEPAVTIPHSKISEVLEGRFSEWKETIEAGWKQEKRDWEEEREKLKRVIEAWDLANGKLEEQAEHQVALGSASMDSSSSRDSISTSVDVPGGLAGSSSSASSSSAAGNNPRRRASKSAKRRAAKRHLNPTLRALLYKSLHNEGIGEEEDGSDSDEAGALSPRSASSSSSHQLAEGSSTSSASSSTTMGKNTAASFLSGGSRFSSNRSGSSAVTTPDENDGHHLSGGPFGSHSAKRGTTPGGSKNNKAVTYPFDSPAQAISTLSAVTVVAVGLAWVTLGREAK